MRIVIVNTILGSVLGVLLGSMGYTFVMWQYWAVFAILIAAIVNSIVRRVS